MNTKIGLKFGSILIISTLVVAFITIKTHDSFNKKQEIQSEINKKDYQVLKNPCTTERKSNLEWIDCEQNYLVKIKEEKEKRFKLLMELFAHNQEDILVGDKKLMKEFTDWYNNSDKNNDSRCSAAIYYTKAGSAYEGNLARCLSDETVRDIELIQETFDGFVEIRGLDFFPFY